MKKKEKLVLDKDLLEKINTMCYVENCPFNGKHWIKYEGNLIRICDCHKELLELVRITALIKSIYEKEEN